MRKLSFLNQRVLITGGASGIGKIMVRKALEKGASHVVIWDLNEEGMQEVKAEFNKFEGTIHTYKVDLSQSDEIQRAGEATNALLNGIDILINNAGIVVGKYFHEHSSMEITKTMEINTLALMRVANCFLPKMIEQNHGAICNIASQAGLIANPKMSVYCASKWAVIGWSDSLRLELLQLKKEISVTTFMPYYINTGMFDGVKSSIIPILDPEKATEKIISSLENRKSLVAIPLPYWFVRLFQGMLPIRVFDWVMNKVFGIYNSMDNFKGRAK
ncbi:SDR family oxidoreductase [Pedobacter flavus]|uniref:SDR family oxidoreductase n=1 Tax=Pedobacter flavus TaxID=3113906 RepID=A0ABU7H0G1_9SPHI|nr:SDR family oxidoreductase [Pedobacter sp. VNH31]MEE1884567.1 SDR family oxidoreductase [Pedobacter sp. VNH31]